MTALRFGLFALGLSIGLAASIVPSTSFAVELGLDPYIEYEAGVTFVPNQNLTRANPPGLSGRVESEAGFNVGGAVGTKFLEHFRAEINVGYRENQVENIAIQGGESDGKGTLSMIHVLTNAYAEYDLDLGVIPYFGLGVGYGLVEIDAHNDSDALQMDADDNAFIWNAMAGVSVPFPNAANPERATTVFSFGYRYLQTEDLNFRGDIAGIGGRQIDSEYDAHELVFGLRFFF